MNTLNFMALEDRIVLDAALYAALATSVTPHEATANIAVNGASFDPSFATSRKIYVDQDSSGSTHNGQSWATAYKTLQEALSDAGNTTVKEQIWVADGTYFPGISRTDTFVLPDLVAIYGGFKGGETSINQRDSYHPTVLSGNIGNSGSMADNSFNIVRASASRAVLDGLTITQGYNDSVMGTVPGKGAGIQILGSQASLTNMIFKDNFATFGGAAITIQDSSIVTIGKSQFIHNTSPITEPSLGGAIYVIQLGKLNISQSNFENNVARVGGAIHAEGVTDLKIQSSDFENNSALQAGALSLTFNTNTSILLSHFNGNHTDNTVAPDEWTYGGAAFLFFNQSLIVKGNIFENNNVHGVQGGLVVLHAGGAIQDVFNQSAVYEFNLFKNNTVVSESDIAVAAGGAISNGFTIEDETIRFNSFLNNTVTGLSDHITGGALDLEANGLALVDHNYFSGNKADTGGGIFSTGNTELVVTHNIFYENAASIVGGALVDTSTSEFAATINITVSYNFFTKNTAPVGTDISLDSASVVNNETDPAEIIEELIRLNRNLLASEIVIV